MEFLIALWCFCSSAMLLCIQTLISTQIEHTSEQTIANYMDTQNSIPIKTSCLLDSKYICLAVLSRRKKCLKRAVPRTMFHPAAFFLSVPFCSVPCETAGPKTFQLPLPSAPFPSQLYNKAPCQQTMCVQYVFLP